MRKPVSLSIQFRLPKGSKAVKASIKPNGEVVFTDEDGKEVIPEYMDRAVHYARAKGPKIQTRRRIVGTQVSVGGLTELAHYDSILVIDTNTKIVNGEKVSAVCFISCRFTPEGDKVRIGCEGKLNIYEFHNVPGNPEMLAILKVARDISRSARPRKRLKIAFVTDSEMQTHDEINARRRPIYDGHYLPRGFSLHYASADTGQEAVGRLMRFCDRQSSKYLQYLNEGSVRQSELKFLKEDPAVSYRYMSRDDLEIVNPVIRGISVSPGSTVSLYGLKDPHNDSSE
jgi:hypothetical protein